MQHIRALGFDLFDTLIMVRTPNRYEAPQRMLQSLQAQGIAVDTEPFLAAYWTVMRQFLDEAKRHGRESHNRFWISTTLEQLGHAVHPDDTRIADAVEAYFSVFLEHAQLLPETLPLLTILRQRYRLGLLSNLTHAPAAHQILARLGLTAFFDVVLVSGDLGYRKPHAQVFDQLVEHLDVPRQQIAFIGDDVEADVQGARQAGLQPIWTTYARTHHTAVTDPSKPLPQPEPPVPTITSWHDLLTLLEQPSPTGAEEGTR